MALRHLGRGQGASPRPPPWPFPALGHLLGPRRCRAALRCCPLSFFSPLCLPLLGCCYGPPRRLRRGGRCYRALPRLPRRVCHLPWLGGPLHSGLAPRPPAARGSALGGAPGLPRWASTQRPLGHRPWLPGFPRVGLAPAPKSCFYRARAFGGARPSFFSRSGAPRGTQTFLYFTGSRVPKGAQSILHGPRRSMASGPGVCI